MDFKWTREPKQYSITDETIRIKTEPHTDLWQRTYYHFRNDNAPVLQIETEEKFFLLLSKQIFQARTIALTNAASSCIWTVKTG